MGKSHSKAVSPNKKGTQKKKANIVDCTSENWDNNKRRIVSTSARNRVGIISNQHDRSESENNEETFPNITKAESGEAVLSDEKRHDIHTVYEPTNQTKEEPMNDTTGGQESVTTDGPTNYTTYIQMNDTTGGPVHEQTEQPRNDTVDGQRHDSTCRSMNDNKNELTYNKKDEPTRNSGEGPTCENETTPTARKPVRGTCKDVIIPIDDEVKKQTDDSTDKLMSKESAILVTELDDASQTTCTTLNQITREQVSNNSYIEVTPHTLTVVTGNTCKEVTEQTLADKNTCDVTDGPTIPELMPTPDSSRGTVVIDPHANTLAPFSSSGKSYNSLAAFSKLYDNERALPTHKNGETVRIL